MGNAKPFITLDDIAIRLYDRVLFEHTDWEILYNQHWAVVGPNGSGKSTLVKALCGKAPVVQGQIAYHFSTDGAKPQDKIAYVSFDAQRMVVGWQDPFYQARWNSDRSRDGIPVSEYLSADRVYKVNPFQVIDHYPDPAAFEARQKEVTELLQIEALLERNTIQLSNGERRKVFIAQALLKNPQLLILDNPFTGLDQEFRARLKEVIARLTGGRMRVMVVETDRDEIPPGITHVLEVEDCRVVAEGPVDAVSEPREVEQVQKPGFLPGVRNQPSSRESLRQKAHQIESEKNRVSQVLIYMENVNVSYNGTPVLQGIDWKVREGEHWALLGHNGAGKTTLLSLILGDNPQAYANKIALFGRQRGSGESIWEIKRRIGWVAPELHLYYPVGVTCFDVVCSGFFDSVGLYHRCSQQQRKTAKRWIERLGISEYADATFAKLSEGGQRLVLVARALVKQPQLLVLDEPCQGLDARNRDRVLEVIDSIGDHLDTSIIYVTHETDELPETITHVIRLSAGRVVARSHLLREERQVDKPVYTAHVGTKFFADGRFRRYPGVTVICQVDENSKESRVLRTCQTRFESLPFADKFAFLPQDSFHMTAIELVNDQGRVPEKWSKYLPLDASMAEMDAFLKSAWSQVESSGSIQMKVVGCRASSVIAVGVEPLTPGQARILSDFRDEVAAKTGVRKPGHDTYRFHITLAYKLAELDAEEEAQLQKGIDVVNELLADQMPTIKLPAPEMRFYHDMSAFPETIDR